MLSKEDSAQIRQLFPMLQKYTFLNTASMAPMPIPTRDAMTGLLSEVSETAYLKMDKWVKTIRETRNLAAKLINSDPLEIAFIKNTSDGISLVASGYRWEKGDEVIITDLEFPSNVYPWLNLEKKGVNVRVIKSVGGRVPLESIREAVTQKTKMVAISTAQYTTGFKADLLAIGKLADELKFLFFVDAIQTLGAFPMDVKKFNIDFLSCGGHKWLCAPEGIGIFYCAKKNLEKLDLTRLGWNTVVNSLNFGDIDFTTKKDSRRFEEGTANLVGLYGLNASLKLLLDTGVENIADHILSLTSYLADGLEQKGYKILSSMKDGERSGILTFSSEDKKDNAAVLSKFTENKILLIERGDGIRVSPHFFNTTEDIDKLLAIA